MRVRTNREFRFVLGVGLDSGVRKFQQLAKAADGSLYRRTLSGVDGVRDTTDRLSLNLTTYQPFKVLFVLCGALSDKSSVARVLFCFVEVSAQLGKNLRPVVRASFKVH